MNSLQDALYRFWGTHHSRAAGILYRFWGEHLVRTRTVTVGDTGEVAATSTSQISSVALDR